MTPGSVFASHLADELPQLVGVLQGRMSLAGPRPQAVAHNERHKVRRASPAGRRCMALEYLRNWSLLLDLYIAAKTVWIVLTGAHAN